VIKVLSVFSYPLGIIYLLTIMWWLTGNTPMDVIETITDIINQPLWQIAEVLK
jgi:formate hydrogenlyase subunit 4